MRIEPAELDGVLLVEPTVFEDDRGFFMETWHAGKFAEQGLDVAFVQDNHSRSARGTLRGLHFQYPGWQGKLVRVISGEVFDVAVDLRRDSPQFGRWCGAWLTGQNRRQLYVPEGFAHGFCVTSETADVVYKCTLEYRPNEDCSLRWDDPQIGIDWPVDNPVLSDKDRNASLLADLEF